MKLRDYQEKIAAAALCSLGKVNRSLVVASGGAGKTIVMAHLAERASHRTGLFDGTSGKTLVLVNREQLLQQAVDKIYRAVGIRASIERAESDGDTLATVVVATVQSLVNRLEKYERNHWALIMVDEVHQFTGEQAQKVFNYFTGKRLGFTATPQTKGRKALANFWDDVACDVSLTELVERGYLVPLKLAMMPVKIDMSSVRVTSGDFRDDDLHKVVTPHFEAVADEMLKHNRKWVCFLPLRESSRQFAQVLNAKGIKALHVEGQMEGLQDKLAAFSRGEYQAICNAQLLGTGWDEPTLTGIINLRPTKSEIFYQQAILRITRPSPETGKVDGLVLDPTFMSYRHRIVRPAFLLAKTEEDADEMMDRVAKHGMRDLVDLHKQVVHDRHEKLRRELEEGAKKKAKIVDMLLMSICGEDVASQELLEYEGSLPWEIQPPTMAQIMSLEKAGIPRANIKDRGHASRWFELLNDRRNRRLATIKQVGLLRKLYVPCDPLTLSFDQASELITSHLSAKRTTNYSPRRWVLPREKFQQMPLWQNPKQPKK